LKRLRFDNYRQLFSYTSFRAFWLGYTFSILGDAMTRIALTWLVWELTGSARALGLLTVAYTTPVIIGGFLAGWLLDRFGERRVMLIDSLLRGSVVLLGILAVGEVLSSVLAGGLQRPRLSRAPTPRP